MQTSAWKIRFWGNVFMLSRGSHPRRNKTQPEGKADRIPLPIAALLGRGQGRGDQKGGKPPIQNLRAKARIGGGILITRGSHRPEEKPQHQTWSQRHLRRGTGGGRKQLAKKILLLSLVGVSAGRRRLRTIRMDRFQNIKMDPKSRMSSCPVPSSS